MLCSNTCPTRIVPFAGARFRQQTTIQLASGAGLFWWEILAPGREARGELFAYDRMELKTDIWTPERLIASERVRLELRLHALSSLARLGDYRYWATFYICRVAADPKLWATAEERLREVAASVSPPGETRWGISTLAADGLRSAAFPGRADGCWRDCERFGLRRSRFSTDGKRSRRAK